MRSPRNLLIMLLLGGVFGLCIGLILGRGFKDVALTEPIKAELSSDIAKALDQLTEAWNEGDVEAFMQSYWSSPDLRFASNNEVERGWNETLARYQRRYPDRTVMGRLAFIDQEIEVLSPTDALVFGRFTLFREGDEPTGLYTLHVKKIDGRWKIMSDHTSTAD